MFPISASVVPIEKLLENVLHVNRKLKENPLKVLYK